MPSYTVQYAEVRVIGHIWQPGIGVCAQAIRLSDYDLGNIGEFTRENVEDWLGCHAGDFREITDFEADGADGSIAIAWADEESEFAYMDAMYPSEDDDDYPVVESPRRYLA